MWAAVVAPAADIGGRYCEDCGLAGINSGGGASPKGVCSYAVDPKRAKALWEKSEKMVG